MVNPFKVFYLAALFSVLFSFILFPILGFLRHRAHASFYLSFSICSCSLTHPSHSQTGPSLATISTDLKLLKIFFALVLEAAAAAKKSFKLRNLLQMPFLELKSASEGMSVENEKLALTKMNLLEHLMSVEIKL